MQGEELLNLAIVDDHPLMREGLRHALNSWPHGRVVLEATDGVDYERQCAHAPPIHIVVVDLHMPRRDGYATIGWVDREQSGTMAIAFAEAVNAQVVQFAMHAGARTVQPKSVEVAELHRTLDSLRSTGYYLNHHVQEYMRRGAPLTAPDALRRKALSLFCARELEFLRYYLQKDAPTLQWISMKMGVQRSTVETYRKAVRKKSGVSGRTATLHYALAAGLV
ncbi:MAG: response regulator transcription factor [Flavobacteriales bacterium]|nr:response regulator transcription factor [Flavobacteriales bacterium]